MIERGTMLRRPAARNSRAHGYRDAAFAVVLAAVLSVGVVGVLLLNTAMQQQADRIAAQRAHIAALATRVQTLHAATERASAPERLARRAQRLHLQPVHHVHYVNSAALNPRKREVWRAHAG